jgi:hypothetical protein
MKNLESILAENMRRFNTKNLNEQDTSGTPLVTAEYAKLKPGYNYIPPANATEQGVTLAYGGTDSEGQTFNDAHVLLSADKTKGLIQGIYMMGPNSKPALRAALLDPVKQTVSLLNTFTFETAFENMIMYIDKNAIASGGKQWLKQIGIPIPATLNTTTAVTALIAKLDPSGTKRLGGIVGSKMDGIKTMLNIKG